MNAKKAAAFRRERAEELTGLAESLDEAGLIHSADPLRDAARDCRREDGENPLRWGYDLRELRFILWDEHLQKYKHTRPPRLQAVEIALDVTVKGVCSDDIFVDPFENLGVNCRIFGVAESTEYYAAWHLDRHPFPPTQEDDFVHPAYHFQYGGMGLPPSLDTGEHLVLEPPRLEHPPLDAVLAIDFVVSNYFPRVWHELRLNNPNYGFLLRMAQQRCWRPYAHAIACRWSPLPHNSSWSAQTLWPQLIA